MPKELSPVQEEYRERMIALAKTIDETLSAGIKYGPKIGFALLVFTPEDNVEPLETINVRCNYAANSAGRMELAEFLFNQESIRDLRRQIALDQKR